MPQSAVGERPAIWYRAFLSFSHQHKHLARALPRWENDGGTVASASDRKFRRTTEIFGASNSRA
jgi:hypothetical protein